ncbi:hypothetical protein B0H14DRAFT_2620707 [Mycena olivaceomarginata]|nr:hypothetical protein B0H14DRAFT_2620707 [Mycena olivaceomarginata]
MGVMLLSNFRAKAGVQCEVLINRKNLEVEEEVENWTIPLKPSDEELPADFDVVLLDEVSLTIGEVSADDETAEERGAMLAWAEVVPVAQGELTLATEMNLDLEAHEPEVESQIPIQGGVCGASTQGPLLRTVQPSFSKDMGTIEAENLCTQTWNNVTKDTHHVPSWNNSLFNIGLGNNKYIDYQVRRLLAVAGTTNLTIVELKSTTSGKPRTGPRIPNTMPFCSISLIPYVYMEIPQELIDAIIDEFALRIDSISDLSDPETKRTLRSSLPNAPLFPDLRVGFLLADFSTCMPKTGGSSIIFHPSRQLHPNSGTSLLNLSASLQELTLHNVSFEEVENDSENSPSAAQRNISGQELVLESIVFVRPMAFYEQMWAHSRNSGSIIHICLIHFMQKDPEFEIDPDILTSVNYLSSIELEKYSVETIALPILGNLANLKALKRIQIVLSRYFYENQREAGVQRWAKVDAFLSTSMAPTKIRIVWVRRMLKMMTAV